jgi:hypothetical protein
MKPPADRPTPRVKNPIATGTAPAIPDLLADRLKSIDDNVTALKTQQNLANGELYARLEEWRTDLITKVHSDIGDALRRHVAEYHSNGEHS